MLSKKDRTSTVHARALCPVARRFPQSILGLVCVASLSLSLTGCPGLPGTALWVENLLTAPTAVTSIMPDSGPTDGGTVVTIRGVYFETDTGVLFGEYAALNVEYVNEGLMRATTPPQGAGIVPIVLIAPDGRELTTESSFAYLAAEAPTQPAAPAIVTIEPDRGPVGGGTPVTIVGSGFGTDAGVLFGDAAPVEFTVVNDSLIMAITPAHEVGVVDVAVFSSGGRTDVVVGGFAFVTPDQVALVVDAVTPSSGPSDGGTMVMIEGSGFVVGTAVFFGSSAASDITVVNDGVITATTPPHAESDVLVELRAPDGREATADQAFTYYFGRDSDGDGLSDIQETEGWDIWVDYFGIGLGVDTFGNFPGLYSVTSDPDNPDTDGDGLSDHEEYLIISDPRKIDTDEDGLDDAEEVNRWLTSPISVDTDGDSRGPTGELVPNTNLFDGAELKIDFANDPTHTPAIDATSPKLADTDGDDRTDWEELDNPLWHPLIADLPRVEIGLEDDLDIRLNVEYAEEQGTSREYGQATTTSHTATDTSSRAHMFGVELGMTWGIEGTATAGLFQWGNTTQSFELGLTLKTEHTWEYSHEDAWTNQQEYHEFQTDSLNLTETYATGSMSGGIRITNAGNVAYHLHNLAMTVRIQERGVDPVTGAYVASFKTLATLTPALEDGVTLAPGASTPVLQVQAEDVNADRVKMLLAQPSALYLETAYFDVETAEGLNFAFIEEVTQTRTVGIVIDFGDGNIEHYRVATNVNRNADGTYAGVNLYRELTELLAIPITTVDQDFNGDPIPTRLGQVRGIPEGGPTPEAFWTAAGSSADFEDETVGFEDIRLYAGDTVMLMLVRDQDGDGLNAYEEDLYGTSDGDPNDPEALDFDGDGLTDLEEARPYRLPDDTLVETGWDVQVVGEDSYHVFSDPRAADADDDGLSDLDEKRGLDGLLPDDPNDAADATDPNKSDTDGDGIPDADDLAPTFPAPKLKVHPDGSGDDGLTWDTAYTELGDAVSEAASRNANADPADDVGEIWVAEGTYVPSEPLSLPSSLGLYGGFVGDETKRGQRNPDPMTNNTVIRGHLFLGDSVIYVIGATGVEIDGFSISDCLLHPAVEIVSDPIDPDLMEITLRNLHFVDNVSGLSGGACAIAGLGSDAICNVSFERCVFSNNQVYDTNGGALAIMALFDATVTVQLSECHFLDNCAAGDDMNGGAILCLNSILTLDECTFFGNSTMDGHGGAIASYDSTISIDSCNFDSNRAERDSGSFRYVEGGAIRHEGGSPGPAHIKCLV